MQQRCSTFATCITEAQGFLRKSSSCCWLTGAFGRHECRCHVDRGTALDLEPSRTKTESETFGYGNNRNSFSWGSARPSCRIRSQSNAMSWFVASSTRARCPRGLNSISIGKPAVPQQLSQYVEIRHENTGQLRQSCCNRAGRQDHSPAPTRREHRAAGETPWWHRRAIPGHRPAKRSAGSPCSAPIDL